MNCPTDCAIVLLEVFFCLFVFSRSLRFFGAAAVVRPLTWTALLLPAPVGAFAGPSPHAACKEQELMPPDNISGLFLKCRMAPQPSVRGLTKCNSIQKLS